MEAKTIEKLQGLLNEVVEKKNSKLESDMNAKLAELAKAVEKMRDEQKSKFEQIETKIKRPVFGVETKTFADAVREEVMKRKEEIKALKDKKSVDLEIKTSDITFGSFTGKPSIDLRPDIVPRARRQMHIRDIFPLGSTGASSVQIIQETTQNGSPAPQIEGSPKAQIGHQFTVVDFNVRVLAAYIRASRQSLDDIEGLISFINTQLPQEILSLEDTQLLTGSGTAPNLLGVITAAGSNSGNTTLGPTLPSPQLWDVIARIMGGMLAKNEPVDFVLINPSDFASMLTAKGSNGQYVSPLIFDNGQPFVYGLPVYVNSSIAADTILVGNSLMAQPTFREGLNISLSYEDGTNFRENMVTIRAEERLANVIYRPTAFFTGTISTIINTITP